MSEVQARPATRGRSSARGGRGGHGARGPRSSKQTNGDHATSTSVDTSADQGELGELKRKYLSQLNTLKELFPDWSDVDLVLTLQETDGDLQSTIERITEGTCHRRLSAPVSRPTITCQLPPSASRSLCDVTSQLDNGDGCAAVRSS
jgi:hypothetical protein